MGSGSFPLGYGFWFFFCFSPRLSSAQQLSPPSSTEACVCSFAIPSTPCSCLPVFPGLCFGSRCLCPGRSSCLALPRWASASCGTVRPSSSRDSALRPGSEPGCFLLCRSPSAFGSFPGLASSSAAVAFTPLRVWLQTLSPPRPDPPLPRPQQLSQPASSSCSWTPAPALLWAPFSLSGSTASVVVPFLHLQLLAPLPTFPLLCCQPECRSWDMVSSEFLTSHFITPQWCQDGEQENAGYGRSAARGRPVGPTGKSLMCRGQPGPRD